MPSGTFQYPRPCGEPRLTHTSTEDPSTPAGGFGSVACGITASFLWVLAHVRFCLCLQDWSICFPQSPWKSYNHIPLTFKARFPGDSQSLCGMPRLGSLMYCSEPSQHWENFSGIIVFQFVGHPPGRYGIWFYCVAPLLPPCYSFFFVFGHEVSFFFFGGFQHPPVGGFSTVCWNFGVLAGDE